MSQAIAQPSVGTVRERIRVRGTVQGVGFRPFVWRLARELRLSGSVWNDGAGVVIEVCGEPAAIEKLVTTLRHDGPPLARVAGIEREPLEGAAMRTGFVIVPSCRTTVSTVAPPDAATCPDCAAEIADPANRRFRYPFTNCTHCGPRLSIIESIPYDRASTTMRDFEMCPACAAEYADPADRRFHAQPNACPDCGPQLWLEADGATVARRDEALAEAARRIAAGGIVAVKGIGGVHLAVDATNAEAVARLRRRKRRPAKPLALMARDIGQIRQWCEVDDAEAEALRSPAAPVVLLRRRDPAAAAGCVIAPRQRLLGFMLPYSPLHRLLLERLDRPIVLTSGNRSSEPQCIDNDDARARLAEIADAFLLHDRDIANRIDDSVVRRVAGRIRLLRRARGYAPQPLSLPSGFGAVPELLAMGGELKNCFGLLQRGRAVLSQHMGDLENAATFDDYRRNLELYARLFQHRPEAIVVDRHPDYLATKLGRQWAAEKGIALIEVQHHHAHVAACLAENDYPADAAPVLGIALDGLGYGDGGELWGGEFLLADYRGYRRLASLRPVPLPGAALAMREPWRNLWAQLDSAGVPETDFPPALREKPLATLRAMREKCLNSPLASSCGRLFDAVAAALGICFDRIDYEGQAAIELEAAIDGDIFSEGGYPFTISTNEGLPLIDPAPLWPALLADRARGVPVGEISARFHAGLAAALIAMVRRLADEQDIETVALSGGVFQNATLLSAVSRGLAGEFRVLTHSRVPMNDGGLALGQLAVAAACSDAV